MDIIGRKRGQQRVLHSTILFLLFLFISPSLLANEFAVDLHLKDLKLKEYRYSPAVPESARIQFLYGQATGSYFLYIPPASVQDDAQHIQQGNRRAMPILLALHGAGRSGASMVDMWKRSADKHGFMVIAPNGAGNNWTVGSDDRLFMQSAIQHALSGSGIKPTRLFLFGHSNGARKAIALAAAHPAEYDAVVTHAGTLPDPVARVVGKRNGKPLRIGIFLGDKDHIFSVASGRGTVRWLTQGGFLPSLYILQNHGHWYYADADRINESLWAFLSGPE